MRLPSLVCLLLAGSSLTAQTVDTLALRAHTRFLADDLLGGRGAGTRGERLAAAYIAAQLELIGLQGAARDGSYFQPVPLREAVIDTAGSGLVLERNGSRSEFATPAHFLINTGGAGAFRSFAGDVVFAGTPATAAAALAEADLPGKVVAVLGTLGAEALELLPDWERRGVAGVVLLVPEPQRFEGFVHARGPSRFFVDADVGDPIWQPRLPVLVAGPELTRALLEHSAAALLEGGRAAPPGGFVAAPLGLSIDATITVDVVAAPTANVAALLPGSDPALRDEVVVYTAHYDHPGIGAPDAGGDSIYNGFSDNAAGVAMLLAIAETLQEQAPARSVLFLFFAAEERGLLGSSFYAASPLLPLERTRAVINLDAGAPPAPPESWRVAGEPDSPLSGLAARVIRDAGWSAELSAASPNSDYWPFLARGVPAIFLIPGPEWEDVDADQQAALRARWDRYHQAGDEWSPAFPFSGLARYAALALRIGLAAAESGRAP